MTTAALTPPSTSIAIPSAPTLPWRRIALRAGGIRIGTRVALALPNPVSHHPNTVQYDSFGRYMIPAIPIVLLLGCLADWRPWLQTLFVSGGFLLQAVFATFFLTERWPV